MMTLDPSGVFGWAIGDPYSDRLPISGSYKLPDVQLTKKMIALESWAMGLIKANGVTDLYLEQPFIPTKTTQQTVMLMSGYTLFAGTAGTRCGCNVSTVELQTWRSKLGLPTVGPKNVLAHPDYAKFARRKSGLKDAKRQWVKDQAIAFAKKMGSTPEDDNEADALCIWWYQKRKLMAKLEEQSTRLNLFDDLDI